METKIVKKFLYNGLNFPIQLTNVEMVKLEGEWCPKINIKKIADIAIKELASQKERLTGNQLRFIRSYFSMSLREFAEQVVSESHTAVNKWEKFGDDITNMDINIEKILRLYIYEKMSSNKKEQEQNLFQGYKEGKNIIRSKGHSKLLEITLAA